MFECVWEREGFECWNLNGDLRGASRRWQHRLGEELWLWLNVSGQGVVWGREHRIFLKNGLFGCFAAAGEEPWKWTRLPGHHEARILVMPREWIRKLATGAGRLDRRADRWMAGNSGMAFAGLMSRTEEKLAELLPGRPSSTARIPANLRRAMEACVLRLLRGAAQGARIPRSAASGRRRSNTTVSTINPASQASQCAGGM